MNSRRSFLQSSAIAAAAAVAASPAKALGFDAPSFWQTRKLIVLHHSGTGGSENNYNNCPGAVIINTAENISSAAGLQSRIINRGDLRIGLINLPEAKSESITGINEMAIDLKKKGCDVVICSSSIGFEGKTISDKILAKQSRCIDLIVSSNNREPIAAQVFLNAEDEEVLVDNAGGAAQTLAGLEIKFNSARQKISVAFTS